MASRRIMGDRMDQLHRGIEEALVSRAKLTLIKDIKRLILFDGDVNYRDSTSRTPWIIACWES